MRNVLPLLFAMIGAVLGCAVVAVPLVFFRNEFWMTAMIVLGPIGTAAGLFAGMKLASSKRGDTTRFMASLVLAVIAAVIIPVALVVGETLIRRPPSYDIGLTYVIVFGPMLSTAVTLGVLLPLGIWRQAQSRWDAIVFTLAAAGAWALVAGLLGSPQYFVRLGYAGEGPALRELLQSMGRLGACGAIAGLVFFGIVRVGRPHGQYGLDG
jgi:hypothetical protein